ncbi:multiubiquitin domain-containing protein [Mycolicibacterium chlorophenolicum]|uniref:Multi-ubiquitin domain-containing protein n=1 Tax=Mycolicibacterium chlorophenolicum TaxID=37916 RepID=A0A0J6VLK4_9MYCO|nr:multiubiquitin domain-containing protein [Mycolicibacterium chlorophenolicum]KMO71109.1 hypothetical protein MCHLDSM_04744 [Mycolicibacterium chlorophenolicum]
MNAPNKLTVYLDGSPHYLAPGRYTGTQIRALTTPAARDLFWDIEDAADPAIAPDTVITISDGMRFYTSLPVTVYLDAHPYTVPAGAISEQQLRDLPTPPVSDDHAIWRDIPDANDRRLARGEMLEISGDERFFSAPQRHPHTLTIIVNTRSKQVEQRELSFQDLVALAFDNPPAGENVLFTITYSKAVAPNHKGSLPVGGVLTVKEGTIVSVEHSDKS